MSRDDRAFELRDARPDELTEVGELTVEAYRVSGEFTGPFSADYTAKMRDAAGRAESADVIVAADAVSDEVLGSVTLARSESPHAHVARGHEREFRMLGVRESARGRGVGSALVEECAFRAGLGGGSALVISVFDANEPAARMYAKQGFERATDRDWVPEPDIKLQVSRRALHCARCGDLRDDGDHTACDAALVLEPPRYCPACRRRMTVQVRPTGWTATCSAHGTANR